MGEHGFGTRFPITTKRKDGTTRRRIVVLMTMADGRRISRTVRTPREADKAQAELMRMRDLELDPTRQTIADFLRGWLASRERSKRKPLRQRTLVSYTQLIEDRIIPAFGNLLLSKLSRRRIQTWVDTMEGSAGTVRNAYAVLRIALGSAVGDSIPVNPAIGVDLPKSRFRAAPPTQDEIRRLLVAAKGDRLEALWRLAIVTGLREGELLGLPRDAIEGDKLRVEGQLQFIEGQWKLGPTKSARSLERITLDRETIEIVNRHLVRMAAERKPSWKYHGLMFVTEHGQPFHAKRLRTEFHRLCERAGIAPRRIHDLRHGNNLLGKDLGIAQGVRMARHGHSTTEMDDRYGGPSEEQDREAAERYAEAIG